MDAVRFGDRARAPERVLLRELDGEAVLLDLETETYFGLNAVATRMWNVLTTAPSIEDAYETLAREYAVDPQRLRSDLATFVAELLRQGLLELGGA